MINLDESISPFEKYCDGYGNPGGSGKGYFVGLMFGIGKTKIKFDHEGTSILDDINAFDKAEVEDVNIGQINMVTVSSFCGPIGAIWGYHVLKPKVFKPHPYFPKGRIKYKKSYVPVYSASALVDATRALFGTVDNKRFPLLPGSHVPCAGKSIIEKGPRHVYCGFALGIAKNQEENANLFMEDLGDIPMYIKGTEVESKYREKILQNLSMSVLAIGENQGVRYKEILVEMQDVVIQPGEIGCALVAAPYFTLAQNAIPKEGINAIINMDLKEWEKKVKNKL
jgi:histidine decarboxylase